MSQLDYKEVNRVVLDPLEPPGKAYWAAWWALSLGVAVFFVVWVYQVKAGMGIAGISHPVGWAVYIANFVFWVGIAHSGTLISAILHLARSKWRTAVSRSAEAMTVFAVMTAGLFPLIHLGRVWVFYYIVPYPSQRQLWPDFLSPLLWDVVAVTTYLIVSSVFWYVGLWPDLAAARDRYHQLYGPDHFRTRLYRRLALGWHGSSSQWRHYGRSYLYFAALATPLVISVHSVVSWDFAAANLPGWHSTIFAPYFVAGAIHSGLAMVLTLMIPMRRLLHLEKVVKVWQFESLALTMLVTTSILAYTYMLEPFFAWYSGDKFEWQYTLWRLGGWPAVAHWLLWVLNILAPLAIIFKKVRTNLRALFVISLLVNAGMWLERVELIVTAQAHDFMPHNWGLYWPRWPEVTISLGALCFFLWWFLGYSRTAPTVALSDVKEELAQEDLKGWKVMPPKGDVIEKTGFTMGALAVYQSAREMLTGLQAVRQEGRFNKLQTFLPVRLSQAEGLLNLQTSPVRFWTLLGALLGLAGGFGLAIGSALVNNLIAGAKHPVSIIPYCVLGFEGLILLGSLFNLGALLYYCRLGRMKLPPYYDRQFSKDRFGLFIACRRGEQADAAAALNATAPESVHVIE